MAYVHDARTIKLASTVTTIASTTQRIAPAVASEMLQPVISAT